MHSTSRRLILFPLLVGTLLGGCGTQPAPGAGADAGGTSATPAATTAVPSPPAGTTVRLGYAGGEVTGGTQRVPVPLGEPVTLVVTGDVADEAHVHGYDSYLDVRPGAEAMITFPADIPGVFEVEMHDSGLMLAQLEVS
ncbi:MAG: hypothetical protein M3291_10235 [Actinomycetota bacterium]|nr:hypothetical protein [Actinomycetota bacterium]